MAPKRAAFLTWGSDNQVSDIKKFIEDSGVLIDFRDLERQPLSTDEADKLIGHLEIYHFLNPMSKTYQKLHLDDRLPSRDEILQLIAEDPTLLRRPIIRTNRLMTVGLDRRKISEMLQISMNGNGKRDDDENPNGHNRRESRESMGSPK